MVRRLAFSLLMSITLLAVSVVSVVFAADGGLGLGGVHSAVAAPAHHEAMEARMVECPSLHKGHALKDSRCVVACFAMVSVLIGQGVTFDHLGADADRKTAFVDLFYPTRSLSIPTPPPDLV